MLICLLKKLIESMINTVLHHYSCTLCKLYFDLNECLVTAGDVIRWPWPQITGQRAVVHTADNPLVQSAFWSSNEDDLPSSATAAVECSSSSSSRSREIRFIAICIIHEWLPLSRPSKTMMRPVDTAVHNRPSVKSNSGKPFSSTVSYRKPLG